MLDNEAIKAIILGSMAADAEGKRGAASEAPAEQNYLLLLPGTGYVRLHDSGHTRDPLWAKRHALDEAEAARSASPDLVVIRFNEEAAGRRGWAIPLVERV